MSRRRHRQTIRDQYGVEAAKAVLDSLDDDLPDGAWLALVEELGLSAEDLAPHAETEKP